MIRNILVRRFASADQISKKTFDKFTQKYAEHLSAFKQKSEKVREIEAHKPDGKPYHHPYDSVHKPINISPSRNAELTDQIMGPQMVSPHYENFMMSRKTALMFWGVLGGLTTLAGIFDIAWILRSCIIPWLSWGFCLYFFVEARKSLLKPMLMRFYDQLAQHESFNLEDHYKENTELQIREQMMRAKSQLEYRMVHEDYISTKNAILTQFLINEQLSLKHHINSRASLILSQTQSFEAANERKLLNKVIDDAHAALENALKDNVEVIEKGMFESALKGIEAGRMTYQSDPLLPFVLQALEANVKNFTNLSKEEQKKLISLTNDQLQSIKANDQRIRKEYLSNEPKIDQTLKANPVVAKQLASWGK